MIHLKRHLILLFSAVSLLSVSAMAEDDPDRFVQDGVPQGKVTPGQFSASKIFPGTTRDYSVYVPAQYKGNEPASLMVFMDGGGYANPKRSFRVPVVFDNLIHQIHRTYSLSVIRMTHFQFTSCIWSARPEQFEVWDCWSLGCPDLSICEYKPDGLDGADVVGSRSRRRFHGWRMKSTG